MAGLGAKPRSVSQSTGTNPATVSVCGAGVCGDAGAFSLVDQRTGERRPFGGDESGEAAIRPTSRQEAEGATTGAMERQGR